MQYNLLLSFSEYDFVEILVMDPGMRPIRRDML